MKSKSSVKIPELHRITKLRQEILKWFRKNQRKYPWRETRDPFKILVAEMMLRRTKAEQVKPVYELFFHQFPDLESLMNADNNKIEEILHPLGLKWRIPAFKLVAREIKEKYNNKVPDKRELLKKLPGVGEYVSGAVLSFAYNKKEWIVDSNIVRLFKRYFGLETSKEGRRDKHIIEIARRYVLTENPRKANLALLDFTSLICTPGNPLCQKCPLKKDCACYGTFN